MKTNHFFYLLAITISIISFASCNKKESLKSSNTETSKNEAFFPQSNAILSFTNEEEFNNAIKSIKNGDSMFGVITRSTSLEGFISLYDEFEQAMIEADDYYQREGGYEEFKAKFPDLYYPEYKGDYAAFLPVSDEAIAKLINQKGKVIISGEEIDLRDVWSYEKIMELGLDMPDDETLSNPSTKALSDIVVLTTSKQEVNSKRKAWIKRRGIVADTDFGSGKFGRLDLCFRKKGWLGWYNGSISSRSYIINRVPGFNGPNSYTDVKVYHIGGAIVDKSSPHRYVVASRPADATSSNFGVKTFYFECDYEDNTYSFTGKYTTDVDALLDLDNGVSFWEDVAAFFTGVPITFTLGYSF